MKNLIILLILFVTACQTTQINSVLIDTPDVLYQSSIEDAMSPTVSKIDSNLIAINSKNMSLIKKNINGKTYILVVTWKQNVTYYKPFLDSGFYNTGSYPMWITTAPELYARMKKENASDVNLRLKQLLGLPPNAEYSYFVEFWVQEKDLFRPCPDNDISDSQCDLCFPSDIDSSYISWINENRISRYYQCELYDKYPWTQLGYTYDWNPENRSHIGLSEFVIEKNKEIIVKGIYTTTEYLSSKRYK